MIAALLARADAYPERPAVRTPAATLSYGAFARMIGGAAARIRRAIGTCGERVLLCGGNSPEFAAAYFAIHLAGGVAVPLAADISVAAARWTADDAGACLALCAAK